MSTQRGWWDHHKGITGKNGRWEGFGEMPNCTPFTWAGEQQPNFLSSGVPWEGPAPKDLLLVYTDMKRRFFSAVSERDPYNVLTYAPRFREMDQGNFIPRPYFHPYEIPHLFTRVYRRKWAESYGPNMACAALHHLMLLVGSLGRNNAAWEGEMPLEGVNLHIQEGSTEDSRWVQVTFSSRDTPWKEELVIKRPQTQSELEACRRAHALLHMMLDAIPA